MSELWLPKRVSVSCDDYRDDTSLDDNLALAVVHKIAYDGKMQAIHYSIASDLAKLQKDLSEREKQIASSQSELVRKENVIKEISL